MAALAAVLVACSGDDTATPTLVTESTVATTSAPSTTAARPTTSTSTTSSSTSTTSVASLEDQIRADFRSIIQLRIDCGRDPRACPIDEITAKGSEAEAFLTDLMQSRIEANLASRDVGTYEYRVDEVRLLGPTSAELVTCAFDKIVLFDIQDPEVPDDDVIFDESQVSAVTTWRLALEDGKWQWASARVNSESVGQDLCDFNS